MKHISSMVQALQSMTIGKQNIRRMILVLAALVIFIVTYLLILPAITLDKEEAVAQGGIDIAVQEEAQDAGKTVLSVDGKDYGATIIAGEDAKLEDADKFTVKIVGDDKNRYTESVNEAFADQGKVVADAQYYELSLSSTPKEKVKVGVSLSDPIKVGDGQKVVLVAFDDGKVKSIDDFDTEKNDSGDITALTFKTKDISDIGVCVLEDKVEEEKSEEPAEEAAVEETGDEPAASEESAQGETEADDKAEATDEEKGAVAEEDEEKEAVADEEKDEKETSEEASDDKDAEATEEDSEKKDENEPAPSTFVGRVGDVNVIVKAPVDAFPENTEMKVEPVAKASVQDAIDATIVGEAKEFKAVDITFIKDGEEVQPASPVHVTMNSADVAEYESPVVVHIKDDGEGELINGEKDQKNVAFDAEEFSVYAVVGIELKTEVTLPGSDGAYEVEVTYDEDAKIPENVHLNVSALTADSNEFAKAKEVVIAEKKAKDKKFNEKDFGFAALDISIVDADNRVVEPAKGAEVKVSIKLKKLPEGTDEETLNRTLEVLHLNESSGKTVVETVAEAKNVAVSDGNAIAEFTVSSFSAFPLTWEDHSATIHYGELINGVFTEFNEDKVAVLDTTATSVSLENNFDGYSFITAYYGEEEGYGDSLVEIEHVLHKKTGGSGWEMTQRIKDEDEHITTQTATVENDSHIYALYHPKGGGNPSGASDPTVPSPTTSKAVTPNDDGTVNIQLNVEPKTIAQDASKYANVMIILDRTTSMDTGMGETTRWEAAKSAINTLVETITEGKNSGNAGKIDFCLVGFGGYYNSINDKSTLVDWTKDQVAFKNYVDNTLSMVGSSRHGTNWEGGMSQGVTALNSRPDDDPTYVIFVTDGNPNCTNTQQYQWPNTMNSDTAANAAYDEARTIAGSAALYGVFCGASTTSREYARLNGVITSTGQGGVKTIAATDNTTLKNEFAAIAQTIINNLGANNVSVDDGVTQLSSVSSQFVGSPGGYEYYISYQLTVSGNTGTYKIGDNTYTVNLNDPDVWHKTVDGSEVYYYKTEWEKAPGATFSDDNGVTWDLSDAGVLPSGVVYTVEFTVWPSQEAFDLIANLNNGTVDYDTLDDDVKAQIDGDASTGYTLATNTHLSTTYTFNGKTYTDPTTPLVSGDMPLESELMNVKKAFAYDINKEHIYSDIEFYLLVDGKYYQNDGTTSATLDDNKVYKMPVNNSNDWTNHVYIAPGFMKDGQVLETGHKYTLDEKVLVGEEYEYEFTPQTVRPMEINGTLKYLVLVDKYNPAPSGATTYYIDDTAKTYRPASSTDTENVYYVATGESEGTLVGTNRKTAELDITKMIVDNTGNFTSDQLDEETFTYRVTLTVPADGDVTGITAYEYVPRTGEGRFTIFGYQSDDAATIRAVDSDVDKFSGDTFGAYTVTTPGGGNTLAHVFTTNPDGTKTATIDITLKRNEILRFTNLPADTQYNIVEMYNNYRQADPSRNVDATGSDKPANIAEQGYTTTIATKSRNPVTDTARTGSVSGTTVSGTIDYLDARYYNQFTNTLNDAIDVELKGTKHLDGYEWSGERYYFNLATTNDAPLPIEGANGRTRFYLTEASGTNDKSYSFGKIRFTEPGTYTYTITEDNAGSLQVVNGKAVQYGAAETITIVIAENNGKLSVESVTNSSGNTTWDADNKVADTTITNTAPTVDVNATKAWENADGTTTAPANANVIFTLYSDGTATASNVTLNGTKDEDEVAEGETWTIPESKGYESDSWKASFVDLPKYKIVDGQPIEIVYTIGETETWTGYELLNEDPVASGETITNKQLAQKVRFVKEDVGNSNIKLEGAIFTFNVGGTAYTVTSDSTGLMKTSDGISEFTLPVSNTPYEMTETKAPDGYNMLTGKVEVTSAENGISARRSDGVGLYTVDEPTTENPYYVVHITNSTGEELPMTGGSGTLQYTLGGLALIMAAALMYGFRKRRRERRSN